MKRSFAAVVVAVLATSALLTVNPAQAASPDVGGWLRVPNIVRYADCVDHSFTFHLDLPPGYTDVSLFVDVTEPDGTPGVGDMPDVNGPDGHGSLTFCGSEMTGTYTATAHGSACDVDYYDCLDFTLPTTRFTVRKAYTKTGLTVRPKRPGRNQVIKFKITTFDERPRGFYRTDYTYVLLQKKVRGRWANVRGSRTFVSGGSTVLKYRWGGGKGARVLVRAVTPTSDSLAGSVSRAVMLRTR